ncbi:CDP-alcohol phosphatidyltransferase family protein [Labrys wisconsinensis]|uniref:CDP-diacylglycerol--glycerol-3-phosphate 3-phosphatidyltransferase n=1 Tax=Labrys wisconsinensis TaxID=425677 RepID=A0ABU0J4Z0_9HYPH|nr:CDP-alcohol phosphatidyltransferase family protein [Labrys wisconsinensis]MDQ0468344.1 cardiolipin synthase [Labrys wisconsinensis]
MSVTIPNLITIARFCLAPVVVWCIVEGEWHWAFWLFVAAGASDGIDGFIAKRFDQRSELGAAIDPLADKVLLISIFVSLGIAGELALWLVILVVFRDLMIISGVVLARFLDKPVAIAPSLVSKLNTAVQIGFVGLILFLKGFGFELPDVTAAGAVAVAALTVASTLPYLRQWLRHMAG